MQKIIYCYRIEDTTGNPQLAFEIISSFIENIVLRNDLEQNKSYHEYYAENAAGAKRVAREKTYPLASGERHNR